MPGPFDVLSGYLEGKGPEALQGMDPSYAANLSKFLEDNPYGLSIISGVRSNERQAQLWQAALQKYGDPAIARKWVAPPGRSMHNHGQAVDLSYEDPNARAWAHDNAQAYGLTFPMSNEPWHVEPLGARRGQPAPIVGGGKAMTLPDEAKGLNPMPDPRADQPSERASEMTGPPLQTNPGGLGGLGGAVGTSLARSIQAIGMALMAAKDRRTPLQAMPEIMMALEKQAAQAKQQEQEQEWRQLQFQTGRSDHKDEMQWRATTHADTLAQNKLQYDAGRSDHKDQLGYQNRSLSLQEQSHQDAIAQQKATLAAQEAERQRTEANRLRDDERQKYGDIGTLMRNLHPDVPPTDPRYPALAEEVMKAKAEAGAARTTLNTELNPIVKAASDRVKEDAERAASGVDGIRNIHAARAQLDKGVITGYLADKREGFGKLANYLGFDGSKVTNSETFRAIIGQQVLDQAKALGTNPSNEDARRINAILGANTELNEDTIRQILDFQEEMHRRAIDKGNATVQRYGELVPDAKKFAETLRVQAPPPYQRPAAPAGGGSPQAGGVPPDLRQQALDELRRRQEQGQGR